MPVCLRYAMTAAMLSATCAAASAAPARPALGTYSGTAADGSTVSFTVTQDTNTNLPAVTAATIYFTAACPSPHSNVGYGVGFGLNADIRNNKASYASGFPTGTYIQFSLVFDPATNTVSGTTATALTTLVSSTHLPTRDYVCTSASQSLTATLQAASSAKLSAVSGYVYDRQGRVVGTVSK